MDFCSFVTKNLFIDREVLLSNIITISCEYGLAMSNINFKEPFISFHLNGSRDDLYFEDFGEIVLPRFSIDIWNRNDFPTQEINFDHFEDGYFCVIFIGSKQTVFTLRFILRMLELNPEIRFASISNKIIEYDILKEYFKNNDPNYYYLS